MKIRYTIATCMLALTFTISFGQDRKLKKAQSQYDEYAYADAIEGYKAIVENGEGSAEIYKQLGNAYYYQADMDGASKWYGELMKLEGEVEPEYYFRYGQALKSQKDYTKSDEMMNRYKELKSGEVRAKLYSADPSYLESIALQSGRYVIENIDQNSPASDFAPSFYQEGIVFSSARKNNRLKHKWNNEPFLDLYGGVISAEGLSDVERFTNILNTKFHESTTAFTKDGNTVYFTRNNFNKGKYGKDENGTNRLKIYRAYKVDGIWQDVEELPFNSEGHSAAHPALSTDEKTLYFSSDMPGGYGSSDLYMITINDDGSFGEPQNLGDKVNTESKDTFPFVDGDNMLYFASDGRPGLGGLDIYVTSLVEDGEVFNVGSPVNSEHDDFSYVINSGTKKGYFASNRPGGKGSDDIYSLMQTKPLQSKCEGSISGIVVDHAKARLANTTIMLYDNSNTLLEKVITGDSGAFSFEVPCKDHTYRLTAAKQEYREETLSSVLNFNSPNNSEEFILSKETFAVGTDLKDKLGIDIIYFDLDKAFIRSDAAVELDKVVAYLKQYPAVKIDVRSHTDSRGSDRYNLELSDRRAKSTVAYIVSQGISADRVAGRGYGETELVNRCNNFTKCSEKEHQKNRRSEFIIVQN